MLCILDGHSNAKINIRKFSCPFMPTLPECSGSKERHSSIVKAMIGTGVGHIGLEVKSWGIYFWVSSNICHSWEEVVHKTRVQFKCVIAFICWKVTTDHLSVIAQSTVIFINFKPKHSHQSDAYSQKISQKY